MMAKRTLKTLSLSDKVKIITEIDEKVGKKMDIAKKYGIPPSTLSTIIKNRQRITEFARASSEPDRKRMKPGKFPEIEEEVWKWILSIADQIPTMSGTAIRKQAQCVAHDLGYPEFQASVGWLEKFRSRHNLKSLKKRIVLPTEASSSNDSCLGWNEEEEFILPVMSPPNDDLVESTSPDHPVPDIIIKQEYALLDDYDWNLQTSGQSPNSASASSELFPSSSQHLQRQSGSTFFADTASEQAVHHQFSGEVTEIKPTPVTCLYGSPSEFIPTSTEASTSGCESTRRKTPSVIYRPQLHETSNDSPDTGSDQGKDHLIRFGDYVVSKLKRMDRRTCILAQKVINDALFEAEMKSLESVGTDI